MNRKKNNVTIVSSFLFHTLYWMMCCVPNTYTLIRDFQRRDNQSIWSFSWGKNQKMSGESKAWQLVRVDVQNPPRQNLTNLNRATNFTPQVVFLCKMRSKLKDFLLIMTNLTADKALLLDPHLFGGPFIQNLYSSKEKKSLSRWCSPSEKSKKKLRVKA